ncbi:alpha/beta hydrolase-fold protein [Fulvivirga sedimenti]|uniref:Phospholipase/carboxylesterase/thioesterase domain-containing protein n=1 Tax=Fulvivirga sedimenti TaxID=2879465 RepID=A0A9X1HVN0_9BACT|nr:alpha/beta hydrolase-fold protein [Fulvivirga sedimenti]MCA6078780.1 hypothetical protein [Fulvivirga sedimenti]
MKEGLMDGINIKYLILGLSVILMPFSSFGQYIEKTFEDAPLPYLGYVPQNYNSADRTYPLILFLHGMGERGDGTPETLGRIMKWGPPSLIDEGQMPAGFIVVAPQLSTKQGYWPQETIHEVLEFTLNHYRVDRNRIYLTGLSMGGNGTYVYAYSDFNKPNRLAAIAPIAAWGDVNKACRIVERNIPVWAFHGDIDNTVRYERGKAIFDALKNCNKELTISDYRFTTFENTGHNSWSKAYSSEVPGLNLYEWFNYHQLNVEIEPANEKLELEEINVLPVSLGEASGIIPSKSGGFWIHNDSGNAPYLIEVDQTGSIINPLKIAAASNYDWEDICKDKNGNIYIGDIGNNANNRNELFIYKFNEDNIENQRVKPDIIQFTYEDQTEFPPKSENLMYDAETLIHWQNNLYIFTKNRTNPYTGYTRIYRLPDIPGTYKATLVDSLKLEGENMIEGWITAGDISPDGKTIVLLGHDKIYLLTCFENGFSNGKLTSYNLNSFTQKEGITFTNDQTLWITDESFQNLLKGKLYKLRLPESFNSNCN